MAKASGAPRIIIPSFDTSGGSFKAAAGENGGHEEMARNLAEALKLDRGDGSDLTPRSRASWASQVEEEHEATGWSGLPRPAKDGAKGAVPSPEKPDDASKKSKKKKNKKKSKAPASTGGEDFPSPVSGSQKLDEQQPCSQSYAENVPETSVETVGIAPELPIKSVKGEGDGSNVAENVDRKGRSAEAVSSPVGRIKGNGAQNGAVWAQKRSDSGHQADEQKAGGGPSGSRLLSGSSRQAVGAKDSGDLPSLCNQSADSGGQAGGSSGGWGVPSPAANEDSGGWKASGPRRIRGEPAAAAAPAVAAGVSAPYSPDGKWDEPGAMEASANWDSGWEVAGSRRGKKSEDMSGKASGASNAGQKGKGGRNQQPNLGEYGQRGGAKQRPGEWDKVNRGIRSPGYGNQEKVGRPSPRNSPGPSNFGAGRQAPANWGKPFNKSPNNSSGWDTQPVRGSNNVNSGASVNSSSILGKLLPQAKSVPESPVTQCVSDASVPLDKWKGGFPAFSGNGSSVFDDYPASLYSDSQCSDDDLDSDTMSLASFDSGDSYKSHSTQRMNKWFRNFFQELDVLSEEQLHEHDRQWHCPACQGGVGAIDWYRGLQPLLAHAKTVRSKRVKLHKEFAEVLEEEIRIRGAVPGTHGSGKYGKWRGLGDEIESREIVWPPMVVVRNTQLEKDEDDKWIGMGNKELLDLFKTHNPVKARHAYGPQGHRGMSVLVFAESPTGYYNAQRLELQFIDARRGKDNWDAPGKLLFQPGGDRILYGYMATAEDLDFFNKHSKGKQNLKWDHKSFQEMVLSPMRRLDEESNKVLILQEKVQREMEATKVLKKTMSDISKRLGMREDEVNSMRHKAREQRERQQIEMDDLETSYKERIEQLKEEIQKKERSLEKVHEDYEHEHRQQCEKLEQQASKLPKDRHLSDEQQQQQALVEEEIARHSQLVELCFKNQEQWEARKVELLKEHHQKMMAFKSRQWQELIEFELKLDQEREEVMETFKFPTGSKVLEPGSNNAWK